MRREEGRFAGARGVTIFHRAWHPRQDPRAAVIIAHGYAEHGDRYVALAERLVGAGYAVVAPDHRGHGRSGGARTHVVRFDDYADDLLTLVDGLPAGVPRVLLGHSMGGLVALRFALTHEDRIAALVLSAPAACPGRVSPVTIATGRALARVAPRARVLRLPLDGISSDPQVVAAYRADPLVFPARMRAGLAAEMLTTMRAVQRDLPSLRVPLLVMQGTDDRLVDPSCGPTVHELAGSADKTLLVYAGLWHEIFNEPERERVIGDLLAWLDAHTPAAAST